MKREASVAIVGAGDFIGAAIARRFAAEGYRVHGGRRRGDALAGLAAEIAAAGGSFTGHSLDARDEAAVAAFLEAADRDAPLEACIFNIGANVNFPVLDTTERVFRKVWEIACYAGFLTGREAARRMLPHARGSIFFTGATASLRGGSGYAAFASAKAGLRAMAQAMARELAPQNIHVAHLVIDAGVDTAWVRERIAAARGAEAVTEMPRDTLMNPASIAETYWQLHRQPRDAWTHELDLRPFGESWLKATTMDAIFYFDFGSPNAYFAHRVIPGIEARTGATFRYVPVLLGGLFKLTGNQAPMLAFAGVPAKLAYERREIERFIARYGLTDFRMNPHFPVNTLALMRGAVAAEAEGLLASYVEAMFGFMWERPRKLDDPAILAATLAEAGLPAATLLARAQEPAIKDRLAAHTQAAFAQGAFGIPSFVVGGELYFGKDRLREIEDVLSAGVTPAPKTPPVASD